jgi:preprotein translocase subunit SecD
MFGLPHGQQMTETDPLPPGSQLLAGAREFDPSSTVLGTDEDGRVNLTLQLREDAGSRFALYTATHIGDFVAILINGDVISVPMIAASIDDGEITLRSGSFSGSIDDAFGQQVAACAIRR